MKRAPTQAQRTWVQRTIEKWRPRLFLGEWMIDVIYMVDDDGTRFADVKPSPEYMEADIRIYPRFWTKTRDYREQTIVHELAHMLTERIHIMLNDALNGRLHPSGTVSHEIEVLTQRICNIAFQQEWR